jgi:enoyl-CoA hydratase/carnithine racemase
MTARIDVARSHGGAVAHVAIDNQKKVNTLNSPLLEEAIGALRVLAKDDSLRAVVITGAGEKAFVGGADINEMAGFDHARARAFITKVHGICKAIRDLPVPAIARIDGYCLGAGLEVAASCDMRAASTRSVFGMPEVKVGIPSVVEAALLPRLIGWGRTAELLMTAENIDARTAGDWGFVERVVAPDKLDAAVEGWIHSILDNGPKAVRLQKALMRRWERLALDEAVQAGIDAFAQSMDSDEPAELLGKFVKRKR